MKNLIYLYEIFIIVNEIEETGYWEPDVKHYYLKINFSQAHGHGRQDRLYGQSQVGEKRRNWRVV